ncbi:PTS sugar transporter subunit IIA [Heyndrickxia acidiproducens]|uniref:PTS sugar transporter subunit IIA n=1 Tax=Heyndrickxia acidiproducens TaxID=1121084 RepID=UPI0004760D52|nr:PTS glucose transporter subunit IIA [Heyndrickxia acidiproducens]
MLHFLKKKKNQTSDLLVAPAEGRLIPITEVNDPVFSTKMMGDGFAVIPNSGEVKSPVSGKIMSIFDTKHAISIQTDHGLEVLVHMGVDTVELKGQPFTLYVKANDTVKAGEKIADIDLTALKKAGKDNSVIVVFTNADRISDFSLFANGEVNPGKEIGKVELK